MEDNKDKIVESREFKFLISSDKGKAMVEYLNNRSKQLVDVSKEFLRSLAREGELTKRATLIMAKYAQGNKLTEKEEEEFKTLFYDILKILGIGVPFVFIPGSSILLPFLLRISKKYNMDIVPSGFKTPIVVIEENLPIDLQEENKNLN